jgi:inositol 1,4,5-triphosphate receptor type 1
MTSSPLPRLVLSRFEIEEASIGENSVESEEDEEEVWLFWKDSSKEIRSKSIRELAQDAKEGAKEDQEVVSYYRLETTPCLFSSLLSVTVDDE